MGPLRWLSLGLLASGCASVGVFQSADTLGRGRWELAAEVGSQAQASTDSLSLYPVVGVAGRIGVSEAVDVGARLGPAGFEGTVKVMLTPRGGTVVSLAPSVGGTFSAPSGVILGTAQAALPVLIGVPLSPRLQLVFAPRVHDSLFVLSAGQAGGTVNTVSLGGAVALVVRLGRFKLIPDVGFLAPLATTTWRSDLPPGTAWGQGRWTFQLDLAFTLGSKR